MRFVSRALAFAAAILFPFVLIAGPSSATPSARWTVTYSGSGTWDQAAVSPAALGCAKQNTSHFSSKFAWSVTWKHVVLGAKQAAPQSTGKLTGTAHEQSRRLDGLSCGDPRATWQDCAVDVTLSSDEGSTASAPPVLDAVPARAGTSLYVEVRASPDLPEGRQCPNVALNRNEVFVIVGMGTAFPGANEESIRAHPGDAPDIDFLAMLHNSAALGAEIFLPAAKLASANRIVENVEKGEVRYPVNGDCGAHLRPELAGANPYSGIPGASCTRSQDWKGTITLVRE